MSGIGQLIVFALGLIAFIGFVTFATAFKRPDVPQDTLPRAQLVDGATSPIEVSRRQLRVSVTRVTVGLVLMIMGGGGLMFVYAWAGLAQMANH